MHNGSGARADDIQPPARSLGRAIRQARRGLTQVELAGRLGCPQSSVSSWETGLVEPSLERVHVIEAALGLPAGRLLIEGGHIDAAAVMSAVLDGDVTETRRWRFVRSRADASFPENVATWLGQYRPLLDCAALLRESSVDDAALAALLNTAPVLALQLGWELWEGYLDHPENADRQLAEAVDAAAIAECRFALWGTDAPVAVRLRVCPPLA